jgi:hypothetical protein
MRHDILAQLGVSYSRVKGPMNITHRLATPLNGERLTVLTQREVAALLKGSTSSPVHRSPCEAAACTTVPEPTIGSRTVAPGGNSSAFAKANSEAMRAGKG